MARGSGRRRRGGKRNVDLWRPVPRLPEVEPIRPAEDPAALVRSLGDPPLHGQGQVAYHYLAEVARSASHMATALAAAGGLLATDDEPDDVGEPDEPATSG